MQSDSKIQGNSETVLGQNMTELRRAHQQPNYCQLLVYWVFLDIRGKRSLKKEFERR